MLCIQIFNEPKSTRQQCPKITKTICNSHSGEEGAGQIRSEQAMAQEQQQGRSYQEMQSLTACLTCLALVYILMPRLPRGLPRLLLLLPCLPIFALVPFSTRTHYLRAILSFMFLWVCPSKLLLLCWDDPPGPPHNFLYFAATVVLPIRLKVREPNHVAGRKPTSASSKQGALFSPLLQFVSFLAVLNVCRYRESLSVWTIHALYCLLVYLGLQGVFGLFAMLAYALLGVESYPYFDKPFLASSLSEFWGSRWNLVASYILREAVYTPVLHLLSGEQRQDTVKHTSNTETSKQSLALASHAKTPDTETSTLTSRISSTNPGTPQETKRVSTSTTSTRPGGMQQNSISNHAIPQQKGFVDKGNGESRSTMKHSLPARAIAMLASFLASGLLHELIFCCINQTHATWEVTMFFMLHGFATVLEVFVRRKFPARQKLPQPLAILCTLGFLFFSAAWLFMPPITRSGSDLRILAEFNHLQNSITHLLKSH